MKPSEFLSAYNNEGYVRSHPLRSEEYPDLATELEGPVSRIEEAYFQMGDYAWLAIENLGKGDQLSTEDAAKVPRFDSVMTWFVKTVGENFKDARKVINAGMRRHGIVGKEIRPPAFLDLMADTYLDLNPVVLTECMTPLWKPLLDGEWPSIPKSYRGETTDPRIWWLTRTQTDLGINNIDILNWRSSPKEGGELRFKHASAHWNGSTEGSGAELDAGIYLTEVLKKAMTLYPELNLTVIPAPPQFESNSNRLPDEHGQEKVNPNADFLIINLGSGDIARVQVKASKNRPTKIEKKYAATVLYGEDISPPIRVATKGEQGTIIKKMPWFGVLSAAATNMVAVSGPDASSVWPWKVKPIRQKGRGGAPQTYAQQQEYNLPQVVLQRSKIISRLLASRAAKAAMFQGVEWGDTTNDPRTVLRDSLRKGPESDLTQKMLIVLREAGVDPEKYPGIVK